MALWKNKATKVLELLCPCCEVSPPSVSHMLCGHFRAWFGYACTMRRAEKLHGLHGHTHPPTVSFREDAFPPWPPCSHMTRSRMSEMEYGPINVFTEIFIECTCMPCMEGKSRVELLCMVAWENYPI